MLDTSTISTTTTTNINNNTNHKNNKGSSELNQSTTSTLSKSTNKLVRKAKFNPHDYVLIFEQVMIDAECREVFHQYLKKTANSGELLDFLNDYREYVSYYFSLNLKAKPSCLIRDVYKVSQRSAPEYASEEDEIIGKKKKVNDFFGMASNLIENYIFEGARSSINIGFCRKEIIQCWANVNNVMKSDKLQQSVQGLSQIIELLNPETLFKNSSNLVRSDLELDQFPRFVRSEIVSEFLKRKGEGFTRSVALNISQGYKVDIRFKPHELISKKIDDKMIYFGFAMLQDTPDWRCVYDKNHSQVFISKTNYTFGLNSNKLKLKKLIFTIPYSLDNLWAMYNNDEYFEKYELFEAGNYKFVKYIEPHSGEIDQSTGELLDNHLAMAQTQSTLKIVPFLKPRQYPLISTVIYEPLLDCICQISPTFRDPGVGDESVLAIGLMYSYFFRLRDGTTKIVLVSYTDLNFNVPQLIETKAVIGKVKSFKKGIMKGLDELTCNNTKSLELVDDKVRPWNILMEVNKTMFPNRSWYREWKELQ